LAGLTQRHSQQSRALRISREEEQRNILALAKSVRANIYFRTESAELELRASREIAKLALLLKNIPQLNLVLDAHTDARGSTAYNQKLAELRAQAVKNHLMVAGIMATRIHTVAFGEQHATYKQTDLEGLGFDRRVRVYFKLGDK